MPRRREISRCDGNAKRNGFYTIEIFDNLVRLSHILQNEKILFQRIAIATLVLGRNKYNLKSIHSCEIAAFIIDGLQGVLSIRRPTYIIYTVPNRIIWQTLRKRDYNGVGISFCYHATLTNRINVLASPFHEYNTYKGTSFSRLIIVWVA